MKLHACLFLLGVLFLASCNPVCPPESITYLTGPASAPSSEAVETQAAPQQVQLRTFLGHETVLVDEVIHGFICDDTWRGTVYVACDIEIPAWEDEPLFLQDCDLTIEPNTVVYVAAHNDARYSNGCSCHK
jgi:hypothetical protein